MSPRHDDGLPDIKLVMDHRHYRPPLTTVLTHLGGHVAATGLLVMPWLLLGIRPVALAITAIAVIGWVTAVVTLDHHRRATTSGLPHRHHQAAEHAQ